MKNWVIVIFILILFAALAYMMLDISDDETRRAIRNNELPSLKGAGLSADEPLDNGSQKAVDSGNNSSMAGSDGASSGGGAGGGDVNSGSGSGGSSSSLEEKQELPADFYTSPCGLYFERYGMCNGTCAQGMCVQEGRSCYCKIV